MALFRASAASASLFSLSFSSVLFFLSFSFVARSYSFSSSVLFGALTPNAPAISLPATAVVFSGLRSRFLPAPLFPRLLVSFAPYRALLGKSKGVGDAGVGGGGLGGVSKDCTAETGSRDDVLERFWASLPGSVSESAESSSQLSATGLLFGFCAGFWGTLVESLRLPSVDAISVSQCQKEQI